MLFLKKLFHSIAIIIVSSLLLGCSEHTSQTTLIAADNTQATSSKQLLLDVYKTPSCGCCKKWISHLSENDIMSTAHHPKDIIDIKERLGIQTNYQSCHTAVSNEGYVFEGHIPAKLIKQFLAEPPPDAIGLSVPGMPLGSPGMEVNDQFRAYSVLLLHKDGSSSIYTDIDNASQQY